MLPLLIGMALSVLILIVMVRLFMGFVSAPTRPPAGTALPNLQRLGFQPQRIGQRAMFWQGSHQGVQVRVSHDYGEPAEFRITYLLPSPLQGHLRRQTQMTEVRVAHGLGTDLSLGDPHLDEALEVDFPNEPKVRAFLAGPQVRPILRDLALDPVLGRTFVEFSFEPTALTSRWRMDAQTAERDLPRILEFHRILAHAATEADRTSRQPSAQPVLAQPERPAAGFEGRVGTPEGSQPPPTPATQPTAPASPAGATVAGLQAGATEPVAQAGPAGPQPVRTDAPPAAAGPTQAPAAARPTPSAPPAPGAAAPAESGPTAAPAQPLPVPSRTAPAIEAPTEQSAGLDFRKVLQEAGPEAAARAAASDPARITELASLLADFGLRDAASQALRLLGPKAVPPLIAAARDVLAASAAREVFAGANEETRKALAEALEPSRDRRELEFLLEVAERLRLTEARESVRRLASHEDFLVRLKAESLLRSLEAEP